MTAALVLQDLERDVMDLEQKKLPSEVRERVKSIRAKIDALQKQLAPILSGFSPQAAGERLVAEMQRVEGGAWSDAEFREKFGLTSAVLHRRRKEHRIIFGETPGTTFSIRGGSSRKRVPSS